MPVPQLKANITKYLYKLPWKSLMVFEADETFNDFTGDVITIKGMVALPEPQLRQIFNQSKSII